MTGGVFDGVTAVISGRAARLLWFYAHLDELAARVSDPELVQAIDTLRTAGNRWLRADAGTDVPMTPEPAREWVSAREAAEMLGMTDRGVRKACSARRLPADMSSTGAWLIHREAIAHFRAERSAR